MICNDGSVDTCRDATLLAVGTQGLGKIICSYSKLVDRFGEPEEGDGFKTQAEWIILTPFGLATVYDWKQGDCYHGEGNGTPVQPGRRVVNWWLQFKCDGMD